MGVGCKMATKVRLVVEPQMAGCFQDTSCSKGPMAPGRVGGGLHTDLGPEGGNR